MRSHGWGIYPIIKFFSCLTIKKLHLTSGLWQHINNTSTLELLTFLFNFYFLSYYEQVRGYSSGYHVIYSGKSPAISACDWNGYSKFKMSKRVTAQTSLFY